jgi:hypothetical protein
MTTVTSRAKARKGQAVGWHTPESSKGVGHRGAPGASRTQEEEGFTTKARRTQRGEGRDLKGHSSERTKSYAKGRRRRAAINLSSSCHQLAVISSDFAAIRDVAKKIRGAGSHAATSRTTIARPLGPCRTHALWWAGSPAIASGPAASNAPCPRPDSTAPWLTAFGPCTDRSMACEKGFTGRTQE